MRCPALLLLLASSAAFAQADAGVAPPLSVRARALPAQAKLGEVFSVEVEVTHDTTQRYELVAPGDLGDFDYVGQERKRIDGKASSTTVFNLKLQAYKLGPQRTPAFTFEVSDPDGTAKLQLGPTDINIVSSLPKDAQTKGENLYDVRPPEDVPIRTWRLLYALAAILGAIGLAYLVRRWLKRPRPVTEKPIVIEPLHVRTNRALQELAALNLPAQGRAREFYFRLSEILRGYLGELYAFEALECTTPELLEALRSRVTPGLPVKELTDFANQSDFVRYAKLSPSPDECKVSLESAFRVVHSTTAAATPAPPPAHASL